MKIKCVTKKKADTVIIEQFWNAAINAKEAGFDGVELHGADGYLPDQFLGSTSNKHIRGGSVENRSRFILETTKSLASVWGADRVAVKSSPTGGYNDMGMPLEETLESFRYLIMELDAIKVAYLALARYIKMSLFRRKRQSPPREIFIPTTYYWSI
ncbi:hypothetical protein M422DRAFT_275774 [Sphaerobolus stellatus SS14]|uniref:NADH:flavin oxidoreductase/NADH oxidase N-terminal domain-containing protein n=1 Tax=Sphaerobolus stellatus (strain SS14) TaxID=990650 RepID=A0A0C9UDS0_SPHS4|nr:hypothetical protein M422DRAFT_275774 [Sphaerobolus stellatus SS14]